MFQCFFDNSGWDGKSPAFIMAGYGAKQIQWSSFSDDWQKILDLEEPKKLSRLKTNDAFRLNHRNSDFFGWSEADRDERLKKFVQTINRHVEHGIICVVPIESYRRLFAKKFSPDAMDRPFFFTFWSVIAAAAKLIQDLKIDENIELVFDDEGSESTDLMKSEYKKFASFAPNNIKPLLPAELEFKDDSCCPPLQAADMISWLVRRYYVDMAQGKELPLEPFHKFLANLYQPKHDLFKVLSEEHIAAAAKAIFDGRARRAGLIDFS